MRIRPARSRLTTSSSAPEPTTELSCPAARRIVYGDPRVSFEPLRSGEGADAFGAWREDRRGCARHGLRLELSAACGRAGVVRRQSARAARLDLARRAQSARLLLQRAGGWRRGARELS